MAKPYRLKEIEQAHGVPLETLIPDLLNRLGTQKAVADHLGVSQATISVWCQENGYEARVVWEKEPENVTAGG